jgi:hypothetical protein
MIMSAGEATPTARTPRARPTAARTRSEEQLHVGTENAAVGRAAAQLRGHREREHHGTGGARRGAVESEPVTEDSRDAAVSGQDISKAEHEVTCTPSARR